MSEEAGFTLGVLGMEFRSALVTRFLFEFFATICSLFSYFFFASTFSSLFVNFAWVCFCQGDEVDITVWDLGMTMASLANGLIHSIQWKCSKYHYSLPPQTFCELAVLFPEIPMAIRLQKFMFKCMIFIPISSCNESYLRKHPKPPQKNSNPAK